MKTITLLSALVFITQTGVANTQQLTDSSSEQFVVQSTFFTELFFADFESDFQQQLKMYSHQLQLDIDIQVKQSITNFDLSTIK